MVARCFVCSRFPSPDIHLKIKNVAPCSTFQRRLTVELGTERRGQLWRGHRPFPQRFQNLRSHSAVHSTLRAPSAKFRDPGSTAVILRTINWKHAREEETLHLPASSTRRAASLPLAPDPAPALPYLLFSEGEQEEGNGHRLIADGISVALRDTPSLHGIPSHLAGYSVNTRDCPLTFIFTITLYHLKADFYSHL
jgi:hypothetical protein